MALRLSRATGNWGTAGTWGLVDNTSLSNVETSNSPIGTTYNTNRSNTFTPGAITVAGILLKIASRNTTVGTFSTELYNSTAGAAVAGTEVTVNTADLPACTSVDGGGWLFFKFASPVTLLAATLYAVEVKVSSNGSISLFVVTNVAGMARALVTTTTGAPAAGDDVIVAGEYTGTGASNTFTVTMDRVEGAITDYGAASTSLVTPALAICSKGILSFGTTAATAYYLRLSGNAIVYSGGIFNMGTVATPIPRDSTAKLNFDCGANVDFGLTVKALGTFVAQGLSRTIAKDIVSCKLNTDEAIASTSLGVDTDTGWLDNDQIVVASTTQTRTQSEVGAMNGNASSTTLTVDGFAGAGGGLAFAHSGTSPTQAEIIMLTRNVQIFGASVTLQAYIAINTTSTVDVDWTEFKWLGSATNLKRGIDVSTTTGSCSIQYCSLHDFGVTSSNGLNIISGSDNITFSNNVTWNISQTHLLVSLTPGTNWVCSNNIFITNSAGALCTISDVGGTFTYNTMISSASAGANIAELSGVIGTINNLIAHSNNASGVSFASVVRSTVNNITAWRNGSAGLDIGSSQVNSVAQLIVDTFTLFGNVSRNMLVSYLGGILRNGVINGDTTFATASGLDLGSATLTEVILENCNFGTVSGIKTAHTQDIFMPTGGVSRVFLRNCILASTNEVNLQTNWAANQESFVKSQKHDQTAGLHKTWFRFGTIVIDTSVYRTASPSQQITPNSATVKMLSSSKRFAVASGTTKVVTAYYKKSAAYNGNQPRLILKANVVAGIAADVVLDTASGADTASWHALSGTTSAITDDAVLECYVDCDGTAGTINVDDWSVA